MPASKVPPDFFSNPFIIPVLPFSSSWVIFASESFFPARVLQMVKSHPVLYSLHPAALSRMIMFPRLHFGQTNRVAPFVKLPVLDPILVPRRSRVSSSVYREIDFLKSLTVDSPERISSSFCSHSPVRKGWEIF